MTFKSRIDAFLHGFLFCDVKKIRFFDQFCSFSHLGDPLSTDLLRDSYMMSYDRRAIDSLVNPLIMNHQDARMSKTDQKKHIFLMSQNKNPCKKHRFDF